MPAKSNPINRFWERVEKTDACWIWLGPSNNNGYGSLNVFGKIWMVHRFSYVLANGTIPEGLHIDHLCRNKKCVNPIHLEAVTRTENIRRATPFRSDLWHLKTHCAHGHLLTSEIVYTCLRTGRSFCKECRRICDRKRARS